MEDQDRTSSGIALAPVAVFALAVVLSAALLFIVEPMFTRMVLPRFGGSSSVWSVAIVFFQATLLGGYLYAHLLTRYLTTKQAAAIHVGVLLTGLFWLPLAVAQPGQGGGEALTLLAVFALSLGVPFIALSANAPLLQAWFLRSGLKGAENPWPLYAASNAGSLGALVAYPLVIEPAFGLSSQTKAWSAGYGLLIALIALAGWLARHGTAGSAHLHRAIARADIGQWLFFAAVPSAGLVAVTAHLSTDVAAAPFLWVVPLALYLLTFVLVFSHRGAVAGRGAILLLGPVLLGLAAIVGFNLRLGLATDVFLHLAGFFILALACHGRLAATRPHADQLTAFYLAMSAGGMIGGVFAALAAPALFSFVAEYPLVLLAGSAALPRARVAGALAVGGLLLVGHMMPLNVTSRTTQRSFFGVHTVEVTADGKYRTLRHGLEIHGAEATVQTTPKPVPLTYYHEDSPISEAIDAVRARKGAVALRIGVIGLGTGAISCLAEPTDSLTYFEIDPAVIAIAKHAGTFNFLSQCAPNARIVMGDARQTLAASTEIFDLLVVDAFSSDSIPVHLLTREALEIYRERTGPDGLILLHISNNHLSLNDIAAATAQAAGLSVLIHDEEGAPDAATTLIYQPTVAALARDHKAFGTLADSDDWVSPVPSARKPWTDDHASVLEAMIAKWRNR